MTVMTAASACPLCHPENENLVWRDARLRVIRVADVGGRLREPGQQHLDIAWNQRRHV